MRSSRRNVATVTGALSASRQMHIGKIPILSLARQCGTVDALSNARGELTTNLLHQGRALLASGQRVEARKELDAAIAILSEKAAWLPELAELKRLR